MSVLHELFEKYGHDAEAALAAYANADPEGWSMFVDRAAASAYRAKRGSWLRSLRARLVKTEQVNLFGETATSSVEIRERVVSHRDGERQEHDTFALAGHDGAEVLRQIADRDEKAALPTLTAAKRLRKIASEMDRMTDKAGRPVTVAEVLGLEAA